MATLETVKAWLDTQSVSTGVSGAWPSHIGFMPDVQAQEIALQPTGGSPQDTLRNENLLGTFQVLVRADSFSAGYAKWRAVFNALQDRTGLTGIRLLQAFTSQPLYFLDSKNRHCFTTNYKFVCDA